MKRILAAIVLVAMVLALVAVPLAFAAGSVTTTSSTPADKTTKYALAWTSDASGVVSANASTVRVGRIIKAEIVPGSGGTQPTDLYDLTLLDGNSVDLLGGVGANLSNAASSVFVFDPPMFVDDGSLTLGITNAGNAKTGTVYVWVQ